jgi:hypothetical protein
VRMLFGKATPSTAVRVLRPSPDSGQLMCNGDAETQECRAVIAQINEEAKIAIIDTPGFQDSHRTDAEVFETIVTYVAAQYILGIKLYGIIYFHPITQSRLTHQDRLHILCFKLCVAKQCLMS